MTTDMSVQECLSQLRILSKRMPQFRDLLSQIVSNLSTYFSVQERIKRSDNTREMLDTRNSLAECIGLVDYLLVKYNADRETKDGVENPVNRARSILLRGYK